MLKIPNIRYNVETEVLKIFIKNPNLKHQTKYIFTIKMIYIFSLKCLKIITLTIYIRIKYIKIKPEQFNTVLLKSKIL